MDLYHIIEEYEGLSSDDPGEIPNSFAKKSKRPKSNKPKSLKPFNSSFFKMEKNASINSMIAKDFTHAKKQKDSIYADIIKWDEAKRSNTMKGKLRGKRKRTVGDIICENHDFTGEVKEIGLGQMNSWNDNMDSTKGVAKILSSLRNKSQKNLHQDM